MRDPLIKAAKKAYRGSDASSGILQLTVDRACKRKLTVASNKLQDVRDRINKLAKQTIDESNRLRKPEVETSGAKPDAVARHDQS